MTNEITKGPENPELLGDIPKSPEDILKEENLSLESEISGDNEWFSDMKPKTDAHLESLREEDDGQFTPEISAIAEEADSLGLPDYDPNAPVPPDFIPAEHICGRCGQKHPSDQPCPVR